MAMTAHNPHIAELLNTLAAQPNLTSTTPGPKCPECQSALIVTYGRRSKAWLVLHSGIGPYALCKRKVLPTALCQTQAEALALAERIARGEA